MKRVGFILLLIFALLFGAAKATHNRAGEILYKRVAPFSKVVGGITVTVYTYSITIVTYTGHDPDFKNVIDRCLDSIQFGDGERAPAYRINTGVVGCNCGINPETGVPIGCGLLINDEPDYKVKLNIYTVRHTYPGPGKYLLRVFDPNRNDGVINMQNSVNVPFYIESYLVIDAFTGANSSPQFSFPPIDKACFGQCFEHNPGAWDPDGDSLSFEITTSRGVGGTTVPGYFYPEGQYGINAVTGELRWCSPAQIGEYNLAFIVKEWRKNIDNKYELMGYVLRDMQVIVKSCPNLKPPVATVPNDTCIEAGSLYMGTILITDEQKGKIIVSGGGGPFNGVPPLAVLSPTEGTSGYHSDFTWQTSCDHIRRLPYQATIKVQNIENSDFVKQVSFSSFNIKVVPPAIKGLTATAAGTSIRLDWPAPACNPALNPVVSYRIYRKNNCDPVNFYPCGPGPDEMGFTLIATVNAPATFYVDDNNKNGLIIGQDYNYVVSALYNDGSESRANAGVCSQLRRNVPVVLNVDVKATSAANGEIYVRWAKPLADAVNFDTVATPGPYTFRLMYVAPGGSSTAVFTSTAQNFCQLETSFLHKGVNTTIGTHEYYVEFLAKDLEVGSSQRASSVFLKLKPGDKKIDVSWEYKTPWVNEVFHVYRKDAGTTTYTMVLTTKANSFTDSVNLRNAFSYCYKVQSEGGYSGTRLPKPLLNFSEESCATPVDLTPPCIPELTVSADCPESYVRLTWTDVTKVCGHSEDVRNYILYYKKTVNGEYIKVAEGNLTTFEFKDLAEVSGCYAVQALDTNGNSSGLGPPFCIDNCPVFELPNVFTPNGDGANDHFKAIRVRQIKEIELYVVDRWGNRVYETTDPYFQWDGVSSISHVDCNEGTYFYVCDVFEPRLKGVVKRTIKGTIHLAR